MGNACFRNATFTPTTYLHSARMKKAAPLPPSKVTTPLSLSLADLQQSQPGPHRGGGGPPSSAPLPVSGLPLPASLLRDQGDECAINELLEGRMDLDVVLPDARKVRMNVERRTPMMDLLVQVTTAHKINPGGHVIHIPTDRGRDYLQYKPNTPIGSLDTNSIHIVPKSAVFDPPVKKMPKMANKPFEQTFRLQVNLPRNQLMVMRVAPRTTLGEVKLQACREKNLDPSRYMLANPQRPDAILDLNSSMSAYGATEITLMSNSNFKANMCNSTSDLIAYTARDDNQKKKGLLGLFTRKKSKASVVDSSSDSLDSRGVSPSRSDGSGPRNTSAKVSSVKKRHAPPPPPKTSSQKIETIKTVVTTSTSSSPNNTLSPMMIEQPICKTDGSTVSHSRHSSDSSGYHEASLLSESPENHSPDVCSGSSGLSVESSSHHVTNRRKSSTPTKPTQPKAKPMVTSLSDTQLLVNAAKKRRAPPPPPVLPKTEEPSDTGMSSNEVIEDVILEEPVTEMFEEEMEDDVPDSKTPPPEPTSSPPISEAESGLVEDIERPLPPLRLTGSPTSEESAPASPHTDSGLALGDSQEDMEDMDLAYSYGKGSAFLPQESSDQWPLTDTDLVIDPPPTFSINPLLTGETRTLHEPVVATKSTPFNNRGRFFTAFRHWAGTNTHSPDGVGRRTSLTSLGTIDDVQNAFDLTIAEAQKVLDDEEKRLSLSSDDFLEEPDDDEPTVVQVSQNHILSRIEAAFSAVEEETKEGPKSPRSSSKDDDLGWDYTIPEPPPAFRNDTEINESKSSRSSSLSSVSSKEVPSLQSLVPPNDTSNNTDKSRRMVSVTENRALEQSSNELPSPVLLKVEPPMIKEPAKVSPVSSHCKPVLKERLMTLPTKPRVQVEPEEVEESKNTFESQAPKIRRPPLLNFTIGTYRKPKEDIFSALDGKESKQVPNTAPAIVNEVHSVPVTGFVSLDVPKTPSSKLMYGMEGSVRGIKGQVRLRCAEMVDTVGPTLVARSASMLNLTPTTKRIEADGKVKNVQRTTSNVTDRLRKAQSVQDLNSDDSDSNANLEQEQERLQQEYSKLHQQFLAWNQQLQDNQNLLEKQKIVSVSTLLPLPVREPDKVPSSGSPTSIAAVAEEVAARSQTLPRAKPKPVIEQPVEEKRTFTLDRRPKSQILANVTIGSWQQRRSSENISTLPATEKIPFHSLDVSNSVVVEEKRNGHHPPTKPPVSKRPVSMYASWQKPQVDETDRQKPKFDVHFSNNQSSQINSLRTSSTKTYFKPPEVRSSSITRQRIPPEDINSPAEEFSSSTVNWNNKTIETKVTRDSNMLKKFVFGKNDPNECNGGGKTVTYLNSEKANNENNVKLLQVNGKVHTSNGLGQRPSFSVKSAPKVVGFRTSGICDLAKNGRSGTIPEPPPPPPVLIQNTQVPSQGSSLLKVESLSKGPPTRSAKSAELLRASQLDPREELMLEIRNFGGRKTLRKVPVSQINWQLKVHGSNSTITA